MNSGEVASLQTIEPGQLFESRGPVFVRHAGVDIPVHYRAGTSKALVVIFHGTLDRAKRPLPFFQAHFGQITGPHQISIGDPTMYRDPQLPTTWYMGSRDLDLAPVLSSFFAAIESTYALERVVFFGASAGGRAALMYSHRHPGSVAVAANPQVDLATYVAGAVGHYRRRCWPGLATNEDLASVVVSNVADLYATGQRNSVVLLNSAGDRGHLYKQSMELLSRLPVESREKVVFHCDYYGVPGHHASVPPWACVPWIRAAATASGVDADALLQRFQQVRSIGRPARAPVAPSASGAASRDGDLALADAIRRHELAQEA